MNQGNIPLVIADPFLSSYIEQRNDYWIVKDDTGYGNALVLKNRWSSRYLELIARYNVKIIRLNEHLGWHGSNVSFLLEIPGVRGVDILSEKVVDVSSVFELSNLKTLSLYCKAKVAGDFSRIKNLRRVSLAWRSVYGSVFNLDALIRINILDFPDKDLSRWKPNKHLKELRLESKRLENLVGIDRFPQINRLDLFRCNVLTSLDAIMSSKSIRKLNFNRCSRLYNFSPISHLSELRELGIEDCGEIQSLTPVCKCEKLESLRIAGNTTAIDGNLSCLETLSRLKKVFLVHGKHYSHQGDELERQQCENG
jgi:hypothetical protein